MRVENEKGFLVIGIDESPIDPRDEFDNLTKMVCFHRSLKLGDSNHDYKENDYQNWDELKKDILKKEDVAIILPLYLYSHSGYSISTEPFNDRWDSGQIGFVYVTKKDLRENLLCKRLSKKRCEIGLEILKEDVNTYDLYISGEVYYYWYKVNQNNSEDSCGGFYGRIINESGMSEYLPNEIFESFKDELTKECYL